VIVSVGEGETLLNRKKLLRDRNFRMKARCYVVGGAPRDRLIHEQPTPIEKHTDCSYIESI